MKKILAMLLAVSMVLTCVAAFAEAVDADSIPDTMTTEDGKYEIALVTDVGQLKDGSFNQGTFDGVKLYAAANGKSYKYYQPANGSNATDDDRINAMRAACEGGAQIVVAPGFLQSTAMSAAAAEFPEVKFVFIDGFTLGSKNIAAVAFAEEQCGYLAGYAVVKEGFEKLGYMGGGGGTNPAVCRYAYGFAQGANAAAVEMGKNVELKYSWKYGEGYSASPELNTMANGWYENGTQIIFACGGTMFDSITAAASANDANVIGVDVDQSSQSETVVTSAMKGVTSAVTWALDKFYTGAWDEIGDVETHLGAKEGAVGLPTATWSMENFTVEEYEAMLASIVNGELVVDGTTVETDAILNVELPAVTILYE